MVKQNVFNTGEVFGFKYFINYCLLKYNVDIEKDIKHHNKNNFNRKYRQYNLNQINKEDENNLLSKINEEIIIKSKLIAIGDENIKAIKVPYLILEKIILSDWDTLVRL